MKVIFLIILNGFAFSKIATAQVVNSDTSKRIKPFNFDTIEVSDYNKAIAHKGSHYFSKISKNRNPDIVLELKNKSGILSAFNQVFNQNRLKQLLPENRMEMTFYVNQSGQILEVSFTTSINTLLTAQELEALEKAIKTNVSNKFRSEDIRGQDFIDIGMIVPYRKELDGSFQ